MVWARMSVVAVVAAAGGLAGVSGEARAQSIGSVRVAQGLVRPVYATAPAGDFGRLFIVEQRGSGGVATRGDIRILNLGNNTLNATPFLSVNNLATGSEQGLLGMAFDPNYASNGYFYINYTVAGGTTVIARYQVSAGDPNVANPASATTVLTIPQPFSNHNAGWLGFGPDGYLYIPMGDGGSGGDPNNYAQNLNATLPNPLLGKTLRIDVSTLPYTIPPTNPFAGGTNPRPEIWAYGLRNPWRPSFDRLTGDFWIADVGQNVWEEINFQPAIGAPPYPALNYGWRCYEGNAAFNLGGCPPANTMVFPIYAYSHAATGGCSVTGGYVYRGCQIPGLGGTYFFADYCNNQIYSFRYVGGQVMEFTNRTAQMVPTGGPAPSLITSFGEDAAGEVYFMGNGNLFKIINRCYPNCDGSTAAPVLNVADFGCFLSKFAADDCYANCDGSTAAPVLNVADFGCFLSKFAAGCP